MSEGIEWAYRIFLYCDDAKHDGRRMAITNFTFQDPGWGERYTRTNGIDHGVTIGEDGLRPEGVDPVAWARSGPKRSRYSFECRKCRRPLQLREETLWAALNAAATHGVSELSLSGLAAIVREQAMNDGSAPS